MLYLEYVLVLYILYLDLSEKLRFLLWFCKIVIIISFDVFFMRVSFICFMSYDLIKNKHLFLVFFYKKNILLFCGNKMKLFVIKYISEVNIVEFKVLCILSSKDFLNDNSVIFFKMKISLHKQ